MTKTNLEDRLKEILKSYRGSFRLGITDEGAIAQILQAVSKDKEHYCPRFGFGYNAGGEGLLNKIMHGEVVTVKGHTLLTGTQWYDRFEKELEMWGEYIHYPIHPFVIPEVLSCAKRASGLEKSETKVSSED